MSGFNFMEIRDGISLNLTPEIAIQLQITIVLKLLEKANRHIDSIIKLKEIENEKTDDRLRNFMHS